VRLEKNSPPPLAGGGWREGNAVRSQACIYPTALPCGGATPPPNPLPQGEGEDYTLACAYPDAYGVTPRHDVRNEQ
jgi:hypothetical protein